LREAFQLFDRDRNGKISKEEISLVLKGKIDASLESEISEIIKDIDENGDEEIDVEEFIKSIERIPNY
jgi:Ca2+-binding EF-hand superfamily protein